MSDALKSSISSLWKYLPSYAAALEHHGNKPQYFEPSTDAIVDEACELLNQLEQRLHAEVMDWLENGSSETLPAFMPILAEFLAITNENK